MGGKVKGGKYRIGTVRKGGNYRLGTVGDRRKYKTGNVSNGGKHRTRTMGKGGVKSAFCKLRLVVNYFGGEDKIRIYRNNTFAANPFCVNLRKVIYEFTLEY